MNSDRTLVIVPTYNERENIPTLLPRVLETLPDADFLLVDDDSPDKTADYVEENFGEDRRVKIMRRTGLRGLGRSYVDGYRHALANGYARVIQMDADFSHDPKYLPDLVAASAGADVVMGSRYCEGGGVRDWPKLRLIMSRFANKYVSVITGVKIKDATAGFRCYNRKALERINIDEIVSNGYAFQVEMTYRAEIAGLRVVEIPIIFTDRTLGHSKISRIILIESAILPIKLRLTLPKKQPARTAGQPFDE